MRLARLLSLILTLAALAALPLGAQRRARIEITLPPDSLRVREGPLLRPVRVLADSRLRDLLHNGFPARLHFRLELWSTRGWFDDLVGSTEWDLVVRYQPLEQRYEVVRVSPDSGIVRLGRFGTFLDVEQSVERAYRAPYRPPARRDRVYYNATLDVEMLSVNDLDEVEQWLRGQLQPAVRGERNPGTAVTKGVRTLFARLLGAEKRHYQARTGRFTTE